MERRIILECQIERLLKLKCKLSAMARMRELAKLVSKEEGKNYNVALNEIVTNFTLVKSW